MKPPADAFNIVASFALVAAAQQPSAGRPRRLARSLNQDAEEACSDARRRKFTALRAIGVERFTYRQLVAEISDIIGVRKPIVSVPPSAGYAISKLVNPFVNDVIITREEISGLMRGLLDSDQPATGPTELTKWAEAPKGKLGVRYANEIGRRIERSKAYADIR